MKLKGNIFSHIWVIIFVSIPQFILITIALINYPILSESEDMEFLFAFITTLYSLLVFVVVTICWRLGKKIEERHFGLIFAGNILFSIMFILMSLNNRQLFMDNYYFFVGILFALALTIIYPLITIMQSCSNNKKKRIMIFDILITVLIPFLFYFCIEIIIPLIYHQTKIDDEYLIVAAAIIAICFFLFFFLRIVIRYFKLKIYSSRVGLLVGKIFTLLIFPLFSLGAYYLIVSDFYSYRLQKGLISEFFLFLAFIIVNAILFIIPQFDNKVGRLVLFFMRTTMLMISTIIFLFALPFVPIVVVMLVFAVGITLLGPYTMFVVSIKIFIQDIKYLKQKFSLLWVIGIATLSFLIFPLLISLELINQKHAIEEAVDYVYNFDLSRIPKEDINFNVLRRSLDNMEILNREVFSIKSHIARFYLTRDGKLPQNKIDAIRKVYFNDDYYYSKTQLLNSSPDTRLKNVSIKSEFDVKEQYWISNIDLQIETDQNFQREYRTHFELPKDVFISDYYLVVNGEKKKGTINEKRTAIWIYNSIVNRRKDPGLLHYNKDDSITFKVFPVIRNEVRETGFTLIHKGPFNFMLDEKEYRVGNYLKTANYSTRSSSHAIYIPAIEKQQLPLVSRKPYLHFLVDNSEMVTQELLEGYMDNIEEILNKYRIDENYKVTLIGNRVVTIDSVEGVVNRLDFPNPGGGFMLKRGLSMCLYKNYTQPQMKYPVFILFTENMENRYREDRLPLLTNPETGSIYHFKNNGFTELDIKTYEKRGELSISDFVKYSKLLKPVYSWPDRSNPQVFLDKSNRDSIFYVDSKQSQVEMDLWSKGLEVYGADIYRQIHYTNMEGYRESVMKSKESSILSKNTAFIVLETAEQEELLKKKEKDNLSNKRVEDLDVSMVSMTEPGDIFLIVFAVLFCLYIVRKKLVVIKRKQD